jgi:epoxyqueuosine reductase
VRGHAAWALGRIGGAEAEEALRRRERVEEDGWVREEIRSR